MLDNSELPCEAKRRPTFSTEEEVEVELSSDDEIEEPNMFGSDSEWSCVGSDVDLKRQVGGTNS